MRALLFETVTGNPVRDLETSDWSYDTGILAQDNLQITVPAYTPQAATLSLTELLVRDKHSIALIDDSVVGVRTVPAAGPVVSAPPTEDAGGKNVYEVECKGIERLLEWRHIRLYPGWPLLNASGKPTGTYDQAFTNVAYGTIMKKLIAESEKFAGGALPITYEADRAGVHSKSTYKAIDGKPILEAMDQLAELDDGVEYDFQPYIDEFDRIQYRLVTGTDSERIISNGVQRLWNIGGKSPDVRNYERFPDPTPVITDSMFTGGKDEDRVLLAAGENHAPLTEGFPRAELWDSSHSTVSRQATLQGWANGALGSIPDRISFDVRTKLAHGIRHGDKATLIAKGHWDLPDGKYDFRVLAVGRSSTDPGWVHIDLV